MNSGNVVEPGGRQAKNDSHGAVTVMSVESGEGGVSH